MHPKVLSCGDDKKFRLLFLNYFTSMTSLLPLNLASYSVSLQVCLRAALAPVTLIQHTAALRSAQKDYITVSKTMDCFVTRLYHRAFGTRMSMSIDVD